MMIEKENGDVIFTSGLEIHTDLTQSLFKKIPYFKNATAKDYGTLPFIHYHIDGETIGDKPVSVRLCFYGEVLLYISIGIDLYPLVPKSWENYSLDIQAQIKEYHDSYLKDMLGKPHKKYSLKGEKWPKQQKSLKYSYEYKYNWGNVLSCHNGRDGVTHIVISYGNRQQEASDDYRKRNTLEKREFPSLKHILEP